MDIRESLFRALDSLNEVSIIHNGKKFSNVKRFDDDKSANDFLEKNPSHGVLHADKGGVYVAHNKNKGVKHTYTAHNEETEHLDEVADKKWDESKEKWVPVKRPAFDPKKERGRASTPDQGQKRSDFDEEADLTKIDTKRLQSMVQLHKHMGQKNPASKAAADRGEAELKSRMKKEEVESLDELSDATLTKYGQYALSNQLKRQSDLEPGEKTSRQIENRKKGQERQLKKQGHWPHYNAGIKKEDVDLDEAVNEKQIRKDLDSGMSHDVVIGKHANKKTDNTDAIRKVIKQHAWDNRKSMKKEEVELDEAYETYHPSYTSAINTALSHHGHLSVSDEDRDHHIASGPRKPSEGNTVSHNIPATDKAGNPHMIHIQVYNKGGNKPFELNTYSSKVPKKKMKEEVDLDEAKTDIYHQHMLKALGKTRLPKDHPYTSAVAKNGDFVVHKSGSVVGRIPAGEHSIKEESAFEMSRMRRQGIAKAKKMAEATDSAAKDATVRSTKPNVTSNTATTTPYDVKPQRIKSAEFNKLFN
jgi:hypothetical protein